jgi:hypothetical protein
MLIHTDTYNTYNTCRYVHIHSIHQYMQYILIHAYTYSTCTYDNIIDTNTYNIHDTYTPEIATYMYIHTQMYTHIQTQTYTYIVIYVCMMYVSVTEYSHMQHSYIQSICGLPMYVGYIFQYLYVRLCMRMYMDVSQYKVAGLLPRGVLSGAREFLPSQWVFWACCDCISTCLGQYIQCRQHTCIHV